MEGDAGASESGDSCYQSRSDDGAVKCTEVREWDSGVVKSSVVEFWVGAYQSPREFYRSRTMENWLA
jgi:hypothetical protein